MKKYRAIPLEVKVIKWNGFQYPDDKSDDIDLDERYAIFIERFYHPDMNMSKICKDCKNEYGSHGVLGKMHCGKNICPGDYLIINFYGDPAVSWVDSYNSFIFHKRYEENK